MLNIISASLAPSGPFTTAPVAGYNVWLDASDTATITQSSNAVSAWTDKSVNAYVFQQTTAVNKPTTNTRTINSLNVLDFDGTNDSLVSTAAASTWNFIHNATGSSIFIVLNLDEVGSKGLLNTNVAGPGDPGMYYYADSSGANIRPHVILSGTSAPYVVNNINTSSTFLINTAQAIGLITDPSNATTLLRGKLYRNNNTNVAVNAGADGGTFTTNNATNTLDICGGGGNYYNGMIGEILIYNSQLSDADIASNMSYLTTKWGI